MWIWWKSLPRPTPGLPPDGLRQVQVPRAKACGEAKAKQTVIEIKEVKFRPGTDDGDYNIKLRNIRRFFWRMVINVRSRCVFAVA